MAKGLNYFALCESVVSCKKRGVNEYEVFIVEKGLDKLLGTLYLQTEDNPLLALAEFLNMKRPDFGLDDLYAYRLPELAIFTPEESALLK